MPQARPVVSMPLRVRFHECDPQGIVFNANYLAYFDMACFEFFKELFGSYQKVIDSGVDTVVAESGVRYHAGLHFDDEVLVEVTVDHLGDTSFVLGFTVRRDADVVATGTNRYVFVATADWSKTPPPVHIREKLAAAATA